MPNIDPRVPKSLRDWAVMHGDKVRRVGRGDGFYYVCLCENYQWENGRFLNTFKTIREIQVAFKHIQKHIEVSTICNTPNITLYALIYKGAVLNLNGYEPMVYTTESSAKDVLLKVLDLYKIDVSEISIVPFVPQP